MDEDKLRTSHSQASACSILGHYDILRLVCESLALENTKTRGRFLCPVTRVCKAFFEPAVDELWKELPRITILLKLLPNFEMRGCQADYILKGTVSEHSLERLDFYSRRVRSIRGNLIGSRHQLSAHILQFLSTLLKRDYLLASLRAIETTSSPEGTLHLLFSLITPTLEHLAITSIASSDGNNVAQILQALRAKATSISQIELKGVLKSTSFDCLESLRITHLALHFQNETYSHQCDFRRVITTLRGLQHLSIAIDANKFFSSTTEPLLLVADPDPGSKLDLSISADFDSVRAIMAYIPTHICCLRIKDASYWTSDQVLRLIPETFTLLGHTHTFELFAPFFRATVRYSFLESLKALPSLKILRTSGITISIVDLDWFGLCKTSPWNNLQVIDLAPAAWCRSATEIESAVSVASLRTIATYCPLVKSLHLFTLMTEALDIIQDEISQHPRRNHGLEKITFSFKVVLGKPFKMGIAVAQLLDHLFPSLYMVENGRNVNIEWCNDVLALLQTYRARPIANQAKVSRKL